MSKETETKCPASVWLARFSWAFESLKVDAEIEAEEA